MLWLLALFLLLLNAFFVAAEFAIVKVRLTQLEPYVKDGRRSARLARHIVQHIDPYLSATQLGITLASLGLGWVGEPAFAVLLKPLMDLAGVTSPEVAHSISVTVAFLLISFLHIVVGEIAPKSLALVKPVPTTLFVAWPMQVCYYMFYPALVVLNSASRLILRAMGISAGQMTHSPAISAEELYQITRHSAAEGVLEETQSELLANVFRFSNRVASEIMAPHNRIFHIDINTPTEQVLREVLASGHSRFPLVEGSVDRVIGILHIRDLLPLLTDGKNTRSLRDIARTPVYVPESMPAHILLVELQKRHFHMAIVIDEYGGTSGLVTIEDVLEELVGEIQDEFDAEQPLVQALDNGGYLIDGALGLADLCDILRIDDVDSDSDTVNGYVLEQLKHMPQLGETCELQNWTLKVAALDGLRIGKLEIMPMTSVSDRGDEN